jgi:hypothetical protein
MSVGERFADTVSWSARLGALALIGLLLMPIDYRGGAEQPHAHSLLQLLLDASDGHLDHEHAENASFNPIAAPSWFDPEVGGADAPNDAHAAAEGVDAGQQRHSDSSFSDIPFLLVALIALPHVARVRSEVMRDSGPLHGCAPKVLSPPPRQRLAA